MTSLDLAMMPGAPHATLACSRAGCPSFRVWFMKGWGLLLSLFCFLISNFYFLSVVREKNTAGETWNRLLNFSMGVLLRARFLCKTSDTMLSQPKMGTTSLWRRLLASINVLTIYTGLASSMEC